MPERAYHDGRLGEGTGTHKTQTRSAILEVDGGPPAGLGTVDFFEIDQQTTKLWPIFVTSPIIAHRDLSMDPRSAHLWQPISVEKTRPRHKTVQEKTTSGLGPTS